jgi:two-component system, response regulator YesN
MLKLLVVDDEKYDRDSILTMLDEEFKGQLDTSEARNGKEAIEISERLRPDIVIMDIKMPGINGLKAIQEIRKFLPNTYFIILTAYDYFDFAVEAVKNNVKEYILKPFSKLEIVEKIDDAISYVYAEKKKRKSDIENQEKLYTLIPVIENELSFAIINNSLASIDYETYLKYLGASFDSGYSMVVQIKSKVNANSNAAVANTKSNEENSSEVDEETIRLQLGEQIKDHIGRRYINVASFRFTKALVYFIQAKNYENEEEDEIKINAINLGADIRREVKRLYSINIRIGIGKCYNGLKMMHKSYEEARTAIEYDVENSKIVHFSDIESNIKHKEQFHDKVNTVDREKIALFRSVEQYIKDHLNEELDLEKTAAKFNLSIYYFSRTFKDILRYNFSDYINMVRIKKAKELLEKDEISIKEICYSVGYSDPNYFSKVFKKYEGVSPSEYKVQMNL